MFLYCLSPANAKLSPFSSHQHSSFSPPSFFQVLHSLPFYSSFFLNSSHFLWIFLTSSLLFLSLVFYLSSSLIPPIPSIVSSPVLLLPFPFPYIFLSYVHIPPNPFPKTWTPVVSSSPLFSSSSLSYLKCCSFSFNPYCTLSYSSPSLSHIPPPLLLPHVLASRLLVL